ncbi:MAG TPA: type IV-A pilus assembly ATPase PilB [Dissulfurispiraceae bacterium]|nr:type IV-A pilus assembly ATPase PilB [Dissulfurispiraceae bacterium]
MGIVGASSLGDLLLQSKLITEEQLLEALGVQKRDRQKLSTVLLKLKFISEESLTMILSKQYGVPPVNVAATTIDKTALKLVPYETAKKCQLIPLSYAAGELKVAVADPSNNFAIDHIRFLTGMKLRLYVASESAIMNAIESQYSSKDKIDTTKRTPIPRQAPGHNGGQTALSQATTEEEKNAAEDRAFIQEMNYITDDRLEEDKELVEEKSFIEEDLSKVIGSALDEITVIEEEDDVMGKIDVDAPIIKLVNNVLFNALRSRASDIHIEPSEEMLRVRYRVDGVLHSGLRLPTKIKNAIISRVKIMAHLDISERRLPQDGRIKLKFGKKKEVDFRVSTLPTLYGEKVVLRILDKSSLQLDLAKLGFDEKPLTDFLDAIEKPYGMILVTGPTGSGKTTTLYSALQKINKPGVNIMTAEDPVEYNFFGINQVQMKDEIGLTFAASLRSFLRQDPDIIMVGEIRDFETAEIAVKAALTGHLVLSTLHTNDAPSTITRLVNMGIEPFLVSSSVILIVAQRLARKICPECKEEHKVSDATLFKIGFPADEIGKFTCYHGAGCSHCNNTGYRGRIALYEVMPVKDELKELILQGASALDIKRESMNLGMATLRKSGAKKVIEGVTTVEEVLRVSFED